LLKQARDALNGLKGWQTFAPLEDQLAASNAITAIDKFLGDK